MNALIYAMIVGPMIFAVITLFSARDQKLQSIFSVVGGLSLVALAVMLMTVVYNSGMMSVQIGNWKAPFGITMMADHFSALMVLVLNFLGLGAIIYSLSEITGPQRAAGYFPILFLLLAGTNGVVLAGDVFNMYVWIEVMVITSFVLLSMGERSEQIRATIPYVVLNFIASMFVLSAVGLLMGLYGTLNMADLAQKIDAAGSSGLSITIAMLFLVGIGIKSAVFPLFFWLPDSYHTPPVAVSALFAGTFTKVGVYVLFRLFTLLFNGGFAFISPIILWVSVLTMLIGVLGAVSQYEFRKLLSFHIISQVGYMTFGLALFTQEGVAGAIFFIVHNILAKTSLFFISGVSLRLRGTFNLRRMGGLFKTSPTLAVLFFISAFSLAGVPPLSGFWGKFTLVRAGLLSEEYIASGVGLLVGFLTTFSMTKIWNEAFWKRMPTQTRKTELRQLKGWGDVFRLAPIVGLVICILIIGLAPMTLMSVAERAASELLNPGLYIETVLGGNEP